MLVKSMLLIADLEDDHVIIIVMPSRTCRLCQKSKAILKRPKTGQQICKDCFFYVFETEVHNTIIGSRLFKPGDRVAIGASGGKGLREV